MHYNVGVKKIKLKNIKEIYIKPTLNIILGFIYSWKKRERGKKLNINCMNNIMPKILFECTMG